jgi:hypothetical protein
LTFNVRCFPLSIFAFVFIRGKKIVANYRFVLQSISMNPDWAEQNLQTIRTLMERSALYRRALAPIMLFAGALGVLAAATGLLFHLDSAQAFSYLWLDTAILAFVGALLIARRQAIKDKEPFWSPAARRVVQAMLPSWLAGLVGQQVLQVVAVGNTQLAWWLPPIWMVLYGFGLYSAAFFMPRGIRLFGWLFFLGGLALLVLLAINWISGSVPPFLYAHWLMGFFFGILHLAYGAYLYLTEKRENAA